MRHETSDLYEAAYMMAEGAGLEDVRQEECASSPWAKGAGRVVFELEGPMVAALRENYTRDEAITNVRRFQAMLERAKDVMFGVPCKAVAR